MKNWIRWLTMFVMTLSCRLTVCAQNLYQPDALEIPTAPFTGDQINLIIMLLCISGAALVILLVLTLMQKNKKK